MNTVLVIRDLQRPAVIGEALDRRVFLSRVLRHVASVREHWLCRSALFNDALAICWTVNAPVVRLRSAQSVT